MLDLLTTYPRLMVIGGLILVLVAVAAADPHGNGESGLSDILNIAEAQAEMKSAEARYEALSALDTAIRNRMMIKDSLVFTLMEGEASLEDTAQQFLELQRGDPENSDGWLRYLPGNSDLERMARHVINIALFHLNKEKNPMDAAIRDRLQCELETLAAK